MGNKFTVFLDLDGVIRDWDKGVSKLFGIEPLEGPRDWYLIQDHICREKGFSVDEFWDRQDFDFWANLPLTPEADQVLELLEGADPIIMTSPSKTGAGGTQAWIWKHLPKIFHEGRYLIGPPKWACANPKSVLIDDHDGNIDKFRWAGGNGILFPRPWNSKRMMKNPVSELYCKLQMIGIL